MERAFESFMKYQVEADEHFQKQEEERWSRQVELEEKGSVKIESMSYGWYKCWCKVSKEVATTTTQLVVDMIMTIKTIKVTDKNIAIAQYMIVLYNSSCCDRYDTIMLTLS